LYLKDTFFRQGGVEWGKRNGKEKEMAVRLKFHGHATWTIETGSHRILIDPFFTSNPVADIKASEAQADFILVSHGHGDHIEDAVDIARRTGALVISNFEIASYCQKHKVQAHPLHIGGGCTFPFGRVELTIAHHGSALPDGSYGGNPCGFIIQTGERTIYHAGDTGLFYDMKLIGDRYSLDVALLPIGDNFTMGPEAALYAVELLRPKLVIPMHYNTFDLIKQDGEGFAQRCQKEKGTPCKVLKPGETVEI
jgi:L-ascorbate metabolism protein UlaG (beta-lactamase superfamily)